MSHRYYEPPEDLAGTVFDPSDETFGPIMAALQAGDFEDAHTMIWELIPDRLVLVSHRDLTALLDYAQEDEEADIEREPENDNPRHIVYVIRRLREQAASEDSWPVEGVPPFGPETDHGGLIGQQPY
jgi:hypothetical protein